MFVISLSKQHLLLCADHLFFLAVLSSSPWSLQCVSSGESSRAAPSVNFCIFVLFFLKRKGNSGEKNKMDTCKFVDLFF